MLRYYEPFNGMRFLANKETKEIHDLENESSMCHIDSISINDVLMIEDENKVVELCTYDGYYGCYWCLSRYNDQHLY